LPSTIASLSGRLSSVTADQATTTAHAADPITIGGRTCLRDDVSAILAAKLDSLPLLVRETTRVPLGTYKGLSFGIVLHEQVPPDVYLEGAITRQSSLSKEHQGPRAVLNALERLVTGYGPESDRVRQDLAIAESQLRDYQTRLGVPFLHDGYLSELTTLRDQLKAGLSGKTPEPGTEPPSVSELAARIKAIKAAHNIEATPQRVRQKQSSAEEPITRRIRRRAEAVPVSNAATPPDAPMPEAETSPSVDSTEQVSVKDDSPREFSSNYAGMSRYGTLKPQMTFQQRLAMERRHRDPEPSLS
jgi:hypothetical protein